MEIPRDFEKEFVNRGTSSRYYLQPRLNFKFRKHLDAAAGVDGIEAYFES